MTCVDCPAVVTALSIRSSRDRSSQLLRSVLSAPLLDADADLAGSIFHASTTFRSNSHPLLASTTTCATIEPSTACPASLRRSGSPGCDIRLRVPESRRRPAYALWSPSEPGFYEQTWLCNWADAKSSETATFIDRSISTRWLFLARIDKRPGYFFEVSLMAEWRCERVVYYRQVGKS